MIPDEAWSRDYAWVDEDGVLEYPDDQMPAQVPVVVVASTDAEDEGWFYALAFVAFVLICFIVVGAFGG